MAETGLHSSESDVALSNVDSEHEAEDSDRVVVQRLTINNEPALLQAIDRIGIKDEMSKFTAFQAMDSVDEIKIPDINDDLQRELAFYQQALATANAGRRKLKDLSIPFSRPKDFFAEMVKENDHMQRIKDKLVDEAAAKKASVEKRRQRDLKKFGKQVQVAKLQERSRAKKEHIEKLKSATRRNQYGKQSLDSENLEALLGASDQRKTSGHNRHSTKARTHRKTREARNTKFGYGGSKRNLKSNTAVSAGDASGFSVKKMKSTPKRLGKSRRSKPR